jgi:hypothetical protein
MAEPEKGFPVMAYRISGQTWAGGTIPWSVIRPHEAQAQRNHAQSLEVLAKRGGLSWSEALAVLEDRPWSPMGVDDAKPAVMAIVQEKSNG